jgi:protoheme IX farnesyltransferase
LKTVSRSQTAVAHVASRPDWSVRLRDYWLLSKPRVTTLVWLTTVAGLVMGARGAAVPLSGWHIFWALLGSWLVVACANALNQVLEWRYDARMTRTADRPIPSGRVKPEEAQWVGVLWGVAGILILLFFVNPLTSLLGAASIAFYVFGYTPLKRYTSLCTAVGAIPGAIPPLAGWAAARNEIGMEALLLFAVQFLWQFPHFWAIAWLNRQDYAAAGFRMLPFANDDGTKTARLMTRYTIALILFSGVLAIYTSYFMLYLLGALTLGIWMLARVLQFAHTPDRQTARKVLMASVLYLPLLLILLLITQ